MSCDPDTYEDRLRYLFNLKGMVYPAVQDCLFKLSISSRGETVCKLTPKDVIDLEQFSHAKARILENNVYKVSMDDVKTLFSRGCSETV